MPAVAAVLAPLDVHRPAVVLLDRDGVARQLQNLGVAERKAVALRFRHVDGARSTCRRSSDCAKTIFCSLEPSARRTIAGLPRSSIGLWT